MGMAEPRRMGYDRDRSGTTLKSVPIIRCPTRIRSDRPQGPRELDRRRGPALPGVGLFLPSRAQECRHGQDHRVQGLSSDEPPTVPRPESPVDPLIVTVQDGLPLVFPGCHGVAVRVVHPTNPEAPSRNMSLTMFYLPPHVVNEVGSHPTEETYVILEGRGEMTFTRFKREVKKGDFIHLPSWCEHGIENTGDEMLVVLVVTSPPNP